VPSDQASVTSFLLKVNAMRTSEPIERTDLNGDRCRIRRPTMGRGPLPREASGEKWRVNRFGQLSSSVTLVTTVLGEKGSQTIFSNHILHVIVEVESEHRELGGLERVRSWLGEVPDVGLMLTPRLYVSEREMRERYVNDGHRTYSQPSHKKRGLHLFFRGASLRRTSSQAI
jgi:hypothetical protein